MNERRWTAILLIGVPLFFTLIFTLLQMRFEYPDILRKNTRYILEHFQAGGSGLIALWYGMIISSLAFIPLAVLVRRLWAEERGLVLELSTVFGVLAGLAQTLGFLRWVILVPLLARMYADPASDKEALSVVFQAFHQYLGVGVGEHLGYLFTGLWTLSISAVLMRQSVPMGWSGVALALGVMSGMLEPFGVPAAGAINAISYLLWALWMVALGISTLRIPTQPLSAWAKAG